MIWIMAGLAGGGVGGLLVGWSPSILVMLIILGAVVILLQLSPRIISRIFATAWNRYRAHLFFQIFWYTFFVGFFTIISVKTTAPNPFLQGTMFAAACGAFGFLHMLLMLPRSSRSIWCLVGATGGSIAASGLGVLLWYVLVSPSVSHALWGGVVGTVAGAIASAVAHVALPWPWCHFRQDSFGAADLDAESG
ncbi:MAG: hypothetical protein HC884_13380 [Chloroflexaceae bacterium]|nr:hypothetical protein [Chloroflexaceae bacterium]